MVLPTSFLTADISENDYLGRTITHKLYDSDTNARIAQNIVLGIGGAKVVDALGGADIYHMNEGHALPLAFHLYAKFHDVQEIRNKLVFTTHTPEKAGNEEHHIGLLEKLGFFAYLPIQKVREITGVYGDVFSHTLVALRLAKIANGVSKLHGEVSRLMWAENDDICEITHITNAQNKKYWADKQLEEAAKKDNNKAVVTRKKELKKRLFNFVANQTGKIFDVDTLTVIWARRFAGYKRADLLLRDMERFLKIVNNTDRPVQVIWAGKPYPMDTGAVNTFNEIMSRTEKMKNCAVVTGYELALSKLLKDGADVWLNNPRMYREASGTSGMTAAMNGAINFSVPDGWVPEYAQHGVNSFLIPPTAMGTPIYEQDHLDSQHLYEILETEIIPTYYNNQEQWVEMMKTNILTVTPQFDSNRMAHEYYKLMFNS